MPGRAPAVTSTFARGTSSPSSAAYCSRIASRSAGTPSEGLPALIDSIVADFQPDLESLRFLHGLCAARCDPEQLAPLARCWAREAETEAAKPGNALRRTAARIRPAKRTSPP